ncbi:MAG TPA: PEGA domain-containing protein [Polyangiaceae bacterium]|nr:PEGA domain-containing protein [Polyangiaceae bacterium]
MSRLQSLVLAIALLLSGPVQAEPAASASGAAATHFERGLVYAKNAELALAAREFEAAYAKSPHYSVLYNLGQAYTALGRPVEATRAFELYLTHGGSNLDASRREEVRALLELNGKRVGKLSLRVARPTLRVWLDGEELSPAQRDQPIPLSAGRHTLLSADGASEPTSRAITIVAGQELALELVAAAGPSSQSPGQLAISCGVPETLVSIDERPVGSTPLPAPMLAAPGRRHVTFQRAGYRPRSTSVTLRAGALAKLNCALEPLSSLPLEHRAWLELDLRPTDARAWVDGRAFTGGALPAGKHFIVVERVGYLDHARSVDIPAGRRLTFSARLTASPEQQKLEQQARARRTSGWILAGLGTVLVASGIAVQVYSADEYDAWVSRKGSASEKDNVRSATAIQQLDDLSIGLSVTGAGLLLTSGWLLWPSLFGQSD